MADPIAILLNVFNQGLIIMIPALLATIGEIYSERTGVINLGLEGIMNLGTLIGAVVTIYTDNPLLAALIAGVFGAILSLLHAFSTITLMGNQILSGLAVTMLGTGINWYLGDPKVFNAARETVTLGTYKQAIAASITIGNTVFRIDWIMLFAIVLAFASWFIMFKTKIGLLIRYSGEEPALVDAMGYNIFLIRYIGVIISGFLAGIAGAYYVLALSGKWNAGPGGDSVLGWGFIAIGITVLSLWNPLYALGATLLFSSTKAMFFPLQRIVGEQNLMVLSLIQGIPYILAIVMLWIISILGLWRRLGIPRALGEPYSRE